MKHRPRLSQSMKSVLYKGAQIHGQPGNEQRAAAENYLTAFASLV